MKQLVSFLLTHSSEGLKGNQIGESLVALSQELCNSDDFSLTEDEVAETVEKEFSRVAQTDAGKANLRRLLSDISVGTSGSLLAMGIAQGIRMLLGV